MDAATSRTHIIFCRSVFFPSDYDILEGKACDSHICASPDPWHLAGALLNSSEPDLRFGPWQEVMG